MSTSKETVEKSINQADQPGNEVSEIAGSSTQLPYTDIQEHNNDECKARLFAVTLALITYIIIDVLPTLLQ